MFKLLKEYPIINITCCNHISERICLSLLRMSPSFKDPTLIIPSNKLVQISEQTFSTSYHVVLTTTFGSVVLVVVEVVVVAEAGKNKQ